MPRLRRAAPTSRAAAPRLAAFLGTVAILATAAPASAQQPTSAARPATTAADSARARILAAEDSRARTPEALAVLVRGTRAADPSIRAAAVRALGRLERDSLVAAIAPLLDDPAADVRAEAANALGQAVVHAGASRAAPLLRARLDRESDSRVVAVLLETLGRIPQGDAATAAATASLIARHLTVPADGATAPGSRAPAPPADGDRASSDASPPASGHTSADAASVHQGSLSTGEVAPVQLLGAARGLYFLARPPVARGALPEDARAALRGLSRYGAATGDASVAARVRRVAAAALVAGGGAREGDLERILGDPDPLVRREAAAGAATLADTAAARRLVDRALSDASPAVRLAAVGAWGRLAPGSGACRPLLDAARDPATAPALAALDLLGTRCGGEAAPLLDSIAGTLPAGEALRGDSGGAPGRPFGPAAAGPDGTGWHRAAHALVSLAAVAPDRAERRIPPFAASVDLFVRIYAARAARALGDTALLRRLAGDPQPNVRTEAVAALSALVGHAGDAVYVAALASDDSQLLQAAAKALEGSRDPAALPALLDALDHLSARRQETSRDGRLALVARVRELGGSAAVPRLQPYLRDFDPAVAAAVADAIGAWTGTRPTIEPVPLPPQPLPSPAELRRLERARVVFEMEDGGSVEVRLFPWDAPTNAWRLARLASSGALDGLTFHRVVAGFVVQGASPGANEYAGWGPFTRDELGLRYNWRGTVGLSTRGRDTGDGQIFINLVDNVRLDHEYTVLGEVTRGMEVVDRMQEGARILHARVR